MLRVSLYPSLFAVIAIFVFATGCDNTVDSPMRDTGEINVNIVDERTNFHAMALEWGTTFKDSLTLRYLLAIWPSDTLSMADMSPEYILPLPLSSAGATLPFIGFEPSETYYVWMAVYRHPSDDPLSNLIYESQKVAFTTCKTPYASISREPITQTGMRAVALNDRVYILWPDGTFERYNPATNSWATLQPNPRPRADFALSELNGVIYAIGGTGSDAVDAFDAASGVWTEKENIPSGMSVHSSAVIGDTIMTFASMDRLDPDRAWSEHPNDRSVMAYVPSTGTWSVRADRPGGDVMGPVAVLGDSLYLFGSYDDGTIDFNFVTAQHRRTIYVYSPTKDEWREFGSGHGDDMNGNLPFVHAGFHTATVAGTVYLVGGVLDVLEGETSEVWTHPMVLAFDGSSQPWRPKTVPGVPLDFGVAGDAVALGSTIYFINGGERWPSILGTYTPALDDCGYDSWPWDVSTPYGIPYTTESAKPGAGDRMSRIIMGTPRR